MMKHLACGMVLSLFLQHIQSKIDMFIISDRLCLSVLIFCTVSAIEISVKSHIDTSLLARRSALVIKVGVLCGIKIAICVLS